MPFGYHLETITKRTRLFEAILKAHRFTMLFVTFGGNCINIDRVCYYAVQEWPHCEAKARFHIDFGGSELNFSFETEAQAQTCQRDFEATIAAAIADRDSAK